MIRRKQKVLQGVLDGWSSPDGGAPQAAESKEGFEKGATTRDAKLVVFRLEGKCFSLPGLGQESIMTASTPSKLLYKLVDNPTAHSP